MLAPMYTEIRPSLYVCIEVKFVGYKVHQCSVLEKNIFCHWNDILLAPVNTVEKKKYAKIGPRWDVYIGVNLLAPTGEIGYNVQKCSVLEKNNFCH